MDSDNYPDPFQDAIQHGLQRAIQITYAVVTGAQIYLHHQKTQARAAAERDERVRRALNTQIRADRDAARAGWAPALDPEWLRQADLVQTARAWGAAMPYADRAVPWYEPAAATAMRKCEERLRDLHPHAMARYDRLRADGMGPAEAMRETAPLFTRPPRVHDARFTPRPALDAETPVRVPGEHGPGRAGFDAHAAAQAQEQRGRQIIDALQEQAHAYGRDLPGEAEQRSILEAVTNLPPAVIDRIVRPDPATGLASTEQNRAAGAERLRAADLDAATDLTATPAADERTQNLTGARDAAATADAATARAARAAQAIRPWERDFPMPIQDVVASTASSGAAAASAHAAPTTARNPARRTRPGN